MVSLFLSDSNITMEPQKENRSEELVDEKEPKKLKTKLTSPASSEFVNIDLRVYIVDFNDKELRVSRLNFKQKENFIVDEIFKFN